MKLHRRQFISGSLAGVAGLVLGRKLHAAEAAKATPFDPYQKVKLGKTSITMSRVGLGTGMNGFNRKSNQTKLGQEKFTELVRGCHERGINWFDCADIYGSHAFVKNALKGIKRDKYVLVSKIWYRNGGIPIPVDERPDADKIVGRFLKELGTDYVDLVLLHCMTDAKWNEQHEKQMKIMEDLKKKGVIRAHGVSCHSLDAFKTAAAEPWVDSIHERINPYGTSMDGPLETVLPVYQAAHDNGKGTVGMKIMGAGKFRDSDKKRDRSVEFAYNLPCLDVMTVGFESLAETDDFAARVRKAVPYKTIKK